MADTVHQLAAEAVASAMMRHPEASATLADARDRLLRREIPTEYWRVFHQADSRSGVWPIEQVACYLSMHAGLMSGRFVRLDINVLESPWPDADRASNAAVITTLPHPFVGHVDQHQNASDWGDGGIRWTEPVIAQRSTNIPSTSPDGLVSASTAECALAPMGDPRAYIPLEIGSTMASVVYGHLMRSRAVARWPYGSTTLTILADAQKFACGQVDLFTH